MEPLPDLSTLNDDDLRAMIRELEKEEDEISFRRRVLHGRIDILRAELVARLREQVSAGEAKLADVERLSEILAAKASPVPTTYEPRLLPGVRLPEPGDRQLLLPLRRAPRRRDGRRDDDDLRRRRGGRGGGVAPRSLGITGPALVVRSGGGMAGQPFQPARDGRSSAARPSARSSSTT